MSQIFTRSSAVAGGGIITITPDAGGAISPDGAGNINLVTSGNTTTTGAGSTITIALDPTVSITGSMTAGTGLTATTGGLSVVAGGITAAGAITFSGLALGVVLSDATGLLSNLNGTAGQVLTANGVGVLPSWEATATEFSWSVLAGTSQTLVVANGYFANNAALTTFTLPATAAVGDTMEIALMNATGSWTLAQNAGQTVYIGNTNTTTGVGGSLASSDKGDWLEIVCRVANTDFQASVKSGNITVV